MTDVLTKTQRKKCMKAIKSKNTKPENMLKRELKKRNVKFKANYSKVFGTPDIVFVEEKVAIFCDSEFFHGKNWGKRKYDIKSNRKFWWKKIETNKARDAKVNRELKKQNWKVLRFWNKTISKNATKCAEKIVDKTKKSNV